MSWLKKLPWLSLILLLITYSLFGWFLSESRVSWTIWITEQGKGMGWLLEEEIVSGMIHLLGVAFVLLITTALTAPITLMTIFVGSGLKSDKRAFISVLAWAFAVVLMICWIDYFARLLVLLCAGLLARLDIQNAGYNDWVAFVILAFISLIGFAFGLFSYILWGHAL